MWPIRTTLLESAPVGSLFFEIIASAFRFVLLDLPLDNFIQTQSNKKGRRLATIVLLLIGDAIIDFLVIAFLISLLVSLRRDLISSYN